MSPTRKIWLVIIALLLVDCRPSDQLFCVAFCSVERYSIGGYGVITASKSSRSCTFQLVGPLEDDDDGCLPCSLSTRMVLLLLLVLPRRRCRWPAEQGTNLRPLPHQRKHLLFATKGRRSQQDRRQRTRWPMRRQVNVCFH
jgi:hypothetical protein